MERELLAWLRERLPDHPRLELGPGDDAALLRWADAPGCVLTVDMLSDEVDFRLDEIDARRAGYKALAVNLSDLAAMAARPRAALIALLLPRDGALELAKGLYEGLLPLAERYDVAIAGGDINCWDHPLAISVTLIGETTPRGPLRRDGAKPGDWIIVTGAFGGSILGKHLDVEPRVEEALLLHERYDLHAGIDVSDGLALDLSRLCNESNCGAILQAANIPIADAAIQLAQKLNDGASPLDHALHDGEDFELILAAPEPQARKMLQDQPLQIPLTTIGRIEEEPGLQIEDSQGHRRPLQAGGYEH